MEYKFKLLEKALREAVEAKDSHREQVQKLKKDKDYSKEYKDLQEKRLLRQFGASQQRKFEEVGDILRGLEKAAAEKHHEFNLESVELQNALKIIELSGSKLSGDTAKNINSKLKDSFPVLKALETIYEAQGVSYKGGIEKLVYSIPDTFEKLKELNYSAFVQQGSLNQLSRGISEVAEIEGFEFPTMVDEAGAVEVMRKSAGLE